MIGAYPDVFQAGVAYSGVPFGCFADGDVVNGWASACAEGQMVETPQYWVSIYMEFLAEPRLSRSCTQGDLVRNAYPGYTGPRPSIQGTNAENSC